MGQSPCPVRTREDDIMSTWTVLVAGLCLSFVAPSLHLQQQMAYIPCSMLAVRRQTHNATLDPLGAGVKRDNQGMCSVPMSSLSPTVDDMLDAEPTDRAGLGMAAFPSNGTSSPGGAIAYVSIENECRGTLLDKDMCLTPSQQQLLDRYRRLDAGSRRRWKRKALNALSSRWTNKEIPYEIKKGIFSTKEVERILSSMREWEKETCITFRPAETSDTDKAVINTGSGYDIFNMLGTCSVVICFSRIGRVGGEQEITLGTGNCRTKKVIMHELGHALGLIHEHQRSDRDHYVHINLTSVRPMFVSQFEKISKRLVDTDEVQYDYLSLMHYGKTFFSLDGKKVTIKTLDPKYQDVIGRVESLSFFDIKSINVMYNCAEYCPRRLNCINGGYQGPSCECVCPKPSVSCESIEPLSTDPSVVSGTNVAPIDNNSTSPNSTTTSVPVDEAPDLLGGNPWTDMQGQGQHDKPILKVTDRQTQGNSEVIYMSTGNISAALATLVPENSQTIDLSSPASYEQNIVGGPSVTRLYLTDLVGDGFKTARYPSDTVGQPSAKAAYPSDPTGQPSPSPSGTANYSTDSFRQTPMTSSYPSVGDAPLPSAKTRYPSDTAGQPSIIDAQPSLTVRYPSNTAGQPSVAARHSSETARQHSIRVRFTSDTSGKPSLTARYPSDSARQPSTAARNPSDTAGQTSKTVRYPSDKARQPSIRVRFTSDTARQPSIAARYPSDTPRQPSMTARYPSDTPGQPSIATRYPSDTPGQPSLTARYPSDTPRQPSLTARYPSDTLGQPSIAARYPSDTPGQPSIAARYPSDTLGQPSLTARYPSDTPGQPSLTARYPSDTAGQPSIAARYPSDTPGQPSIAARYPSDTPGQPSIAARYPSDTPGQPSIAARYPSDTPGQPSLTARYPSDRAGQSSVLEQYSLNPSTQVQVSTRFPSDSDRQTVIRTRYTSNPDKRPSGQTARFQAPRVRQPSMKAGYSLTSGRRSLRLGRNGRQGVDRSLQSFVQQNPRSKYVPYANRQAQRVKVSQRLPAIPASRNNAFTGAFGNRLAPQSQSPDAQGERFKFHIPGDLILSALQDAVKEISGRMPTPSASWAAQQQLQPGPQQPQAPEPLLQIRPDNPSANLQPPIELESHPQPQVQSQYENRTQPQPQQQTQEESQIQSQMSSAPLPEPESQSQLPPETQSQTQPQPSSLQNPTQTQPQSQSQIPPETQSQTQPESPNLQSPPERQSQSQIQTEIQSQTQPESLNLQSPPERQSQSQLPTETQSQTQPELSNLQSPPQRHSQIPSEIQSQPPSQVQPESQPPPYQPLRLQPRSRRPYMYPQQEPKPLPRRVPTPLKRQFRRNGPQQNLTPQTRRQSPLRSKRPVRLEASVPRVQPRGARPSVPDRQAVRRNKLLNSQRSTERAKAMDRQWPQRRDQFRDQTQGQGRSGMVRPRGTLRTTGSASGQRTRGSRCFDLVASCRHFADASSCRKSNFVRQNCRRTCQIC